MTKEVDWEEVEKIAIEFDELIDEYADLHQDIAKAFSEEQFEEKIQTLKQFYPNTEETKNVIQFFLESQSAIIDCEEAYFKARKKVKKKINKRMKEFGLKEESLN